MDEILDDKYIVLAIYQRGFFNNFIFLNYKFKNAKYKIKITIK